VIAGDLECETTDGGLVTIHAKTDLVAMPDFEKEPHADD
jgi:hypothetical protein